MLNETIVQFVDLYGYLAFFLAFCLGPFGIPVPNEVTMLTAGMMADLGILNPWLIYFCILTGLLTAITIGFFIGEVSGKKIVKIFKNKKSHRHFMKAEKLFLKYGDLALCIGFFIPVVRYVVPVFAGMSGVKFKKFLVLSYTSSIVWTALFFGLGFVFGNPISQILKLIDVKIVGSTTLIIVILFLMTKLFRSLRMKKEQESDMLMEIEK